jgi:hypothetical protein
MKRTLALSILMILVIAACKSKKKEPEKNFVSVLSLIEKQVALVEKSLYSIKKIVTADSLHIDTTYIRREEFRDAAKDFLSIPDLSDKKIAKRFKEETMFDNTINRFIITYAPENPEKEEIQKLEFLVTPDVPPGENVNNIIINRMINNKDSSIQKNMLWQTNKSFQVVTILQLPGKRETTNTVKVIWNEDQNQ